MPNLCTLSRGIILAKEQLGHSYTFWTMLMIFSPVANFGDQPLHILIDQLSTVRIRSCMWSSSMRLSRFLNENEKKVWPKLLDYLLDSWADRVIGPHCDYMSEKTSFRTQYILPTYYDSNLLAPFIYFAEPDLTVYGSFG